jgi:hypothetical protein
MGKQEVNSKWLEATFGCKRCDCGEVVYSWLKVEYDDGSSETVKTRGGICPDCGYQNHY